MRYEFWAHQTSGEKYAIRRDEAGAVTGFCGPLAWTELDTSLLPNFHYDDYAFDLPWLLENEDDYRLYEVTQ